MARDFALKVNGEFSILGDLPAAVRSVSISSFDDDFLSIAGAPLLDLGIAVKIVQEDSLVLGLVVESRVDGSAKIKIIHKLSNLSELTRLAGQFACPFPSRPEPEPTLS